MMQNRSFMSLAESFSPCKKSQIHDSFRDMSEACVSRMSVRSTEVYEQMVDREWADLLQSISPDKQNSGFGFDYFKDLMI